MKRPVYIDALIVKTNSCFISLSPWRHRFTSRPARVRFMVEIVIFFRPMESHFLVRQGPLIIEALRSHSDTHTQPRYDSSGRVISPTQRSLPRSILLSHIHAHGANQSYNPSKPAATNSRVRRPSHCNRPKHLQWERVLLEYSDFPPLILTKCFVILTQYRAGDKIKKNEMGWEYGAYG